MQHSWGVCGTAANAATYIHMKHDLKYYIRDWSVFESQMANCNIHSGRGTLSNLSDHGWVLPKTCLNSQKKGFPTQAAKFAPGEAGISHSTSPMLAWK